MNTTERILPAGFEARVHAEMPADSARALISALRSAPPAGASVRLNIAKGARPGAGLGQGVPLGGGACYRLAGERPVFAFDPAWQAGLYYVQDASSMAVTAAVGELRARFFDENDSLHYLDACAAPGGKSIAALDVLPPGSVLVANEFDRRRAGILVENIMRWGDPRAIVTSGDTSRFGRLPAFFDIVGVDAPCSGEGMMRKAPEAIAQWSPNLVESCAELQREIIANVWPSLRPGGILLYSTCTFSRAENEENVAWIEREFDAERIALDCFEGNAEIVTLAPSTYRFMPGLFDGEGLFIAALRKPEGNARGINIPGSKIKPDATARKYALQVLGEGWTVLDGPSITAVPIDRLPLYSMLVKELKPLAYGVELGAAKGRDILPSEVLALSTALRPEAFPRADFRTPSEAISYLRGESLGALPDGTPRGIVAMGWDGSPVGWAKNIGSRANNLFPQALRLKTLPPESWRPPEIIAKI